MALFHSNEGLHYCARWLRFLPNALAWRWLLKRGMVPHVIVHSQFVRDIVVRYGCEPSRVSIIALGTKSRDLVGRAPAQVGPAARIVTVGGIAHTKGQHDMIAALPAIAKRFSEVRYEVIGEVRDRSYAEYLLLISLDAGVADHVQLQEGLSDEARDHFLAGADLYVQPSHEEGFCLAFTEAARIVPRLLGTNTGAIAAVCQGDNAARVIASKDPAALAEAAVNLLEQLPEPDVINFRAQRLDAQFGWHLNFIDAHEQLYRGAVSLRAD